MEIYECGFETFKSSCKTVISRLLSVSQNISLLIFVIKIYKSKHQMEPRKENNQETSPTSQQNMDKPEEGGGTL
jgi:hypothetical protein